MLRHRLQYRIVHQQDNVVVKWKAIISNEEMPSEIGGALVDFSKNLVYKLFCTFLDIIVIFLENS
jgi:hypothetical protein